MADLAKVGDPVSCPVCGITSIANGSPDTLLDHQPVALVGVSRTACPCASVIVSGLSWFHIDDCYAAVHGSMTASGGTVLAVSTAKTGAPGSVASALAAALRDPNRVTYNGQRYGYQYDSSQPHLKGGMAFIAEPQSPCVFAKTCTVPSDSTEAGTRIEPVSNFGQAVVMGSTAIASTEGGATLGRVAGQAALETLGTWSLRGAAAAAGTAASTLLLALWPTSMGTSTLSEEQLRGMMVAPTRVRFQFRRDAEGIMRVYGIHTSATSGMDSVPVVDVGWNKDRSAMEAALNGITIIWTPNNGPIVQAPTTYPGVTDALNNILVHPVAEDVDSQIEIYPASDDLTLQDCILVFPIDSGVPPLYLVFAKPAVRPLEVDVYGAFDRRPRNGLHVDHMPSQAAIRRHLKALSLDLGAQVIDQLLKNVASIAVPARIHQKYSETYGWRNTKVRQAIDSGDLRAAVDSNFNTIKPYLLEEGYSEGNIEDAREQMHQINKEQGWY